jgi:hypothetical protein
MSQTMIITKFYRSSKHHLRETLSTNPNVKTSPTAVSSSVIYHDEPTATRTVYENNPYKIVPIHVDTAASPERCHAQIREVVQILCPFLTTMSSSSPSSSSPPSADTSKTTLSIRPLTGGLSNLLFLVSGNIRRVPDMTLLVSVHNHKRYRLSILFPL